MTDARSKNRLVVLMVTLGLVLGGGILIVVFGVPFAFTAVQQATDAARREQVANNLNQIKKALENYEKQPLEFRTISLNGDKGGMLAVIDEQPLLVNSRTAWTEWTLRETDKGWTIQGRVSEKKPEPRFLAVDAKGTVTLVAKLGDGAYWKLTRKGTGHSFDATIQASGGKFDGWYFGFLDKQEQIERGNTKYKSYRPEISEKPGPRMNLYIFIDGP